MTDIALAERQAAAFRRGNTVDRLLRACGAGNRTDNDRQKDCPWPHTLTLPRRRGSALIHVNRLSVLRTGSGFGDDLDQCGMLPARSIWRSSWRENRVQLPLQITFRHMDASEALASRIRGRAEDLIRFCDRIIACHVVIECRHPRHLQGNLFQVRVDLVVPGREIVVGRDPAARHAHDDAYVAVRDAFDAARRLLEDYVREARGDVKLHAVRDHGRIARLLADHDCGFIETGDGAEIYFHRNSVADGGFERLAVGDEVRFVAQDGESAQGPQASAVTPLGRHHLPPADAAHG